MDRHEQNLLTALEVCVLVGCSYNTLNYWYKWAKKNPNNEYAKLLPKYLDTGIRQTRYWRKEDIPAIIHFKNSLPQGRNGLMGDITQKYRREKKRRDKIERSKKRGPGRPRKDGRDPIRRKGVKSDIESTDSAVRREE